LAIEKQAVAVLDYLELDSRVGSVSSTGKVSYRRIRGLGSNPAYTKNQLMSWLDDKEQSS
jgi:hypothetical protein